MPSRVNFQGAGVSALLARRGTPDGWPGLLGDLAACFHFSARELMTMPFDEVLFWHAQAVRHFPKEG